MLQKEMNWIPEKLKKADTWSYVLKRIIYISGFVALCLLDQVVGSATGYIQYGLKNYTGVILAVIMLTAYKVRDFLKVPYLIWCIVFFVGRHFALGWGSTHSGNYMEFQSNLWVIGIYGLLLIRMVYLYAVERKKPRVHWVPFVISAVMLIGMAVIRTDYDWPKSLCLIFLFFYLTDFKEKDLNNLYAGMMEGMILGFLIIQAQAWLYRPYDSPRYLGMYSHSNWNALLYVCAYCAVLCRWYLMKLKRQHVIFRLPLILLAGLVVGTAMFTGSRTGVITLIAVTLVFLVFQMLSRRKWKLLELVLDGILLVVSIGVCILPSYWLIRYVPVYGNDPIYFEADNQSKKIQKNDPADHARYVEFDEAKSMIYNRYLWFLEAEQREEASDSVSDWIDRLFRPLQADAAVAAKADEKEAVDEMSAEEEYVVPGSDREHPLVRTFDEDMAGYDIRLDIYKYFWNKLPLIGERNNVQGVWLSYNFLASHCHNVFLQIAYDFGIIVGVLFVLVTLMVYGRVLIGLIKRKSGSWYYRLCVTAMFTTAFVVFGMFEMVSTYGQLIFTLFFMLQYIVYHKRGDEVPGRKPVAVTDRGENAAVADKEETASVSEETGDADRKPKETQEPVKESEDALVDKELQESITLCENTQIDKESQEQAKVHAELQTGEVLQESTSACDEPQDENVAVLLYD